MYQQSLVKNNNLKIINSMINLERKHKTYFNIVEKHHLKITSGNNNQIIIIFWMHVEDQVCVM